ncbi:MAG: glycoside hydrolase family 28 protein [Duncaniella sp.]|nr:glycoside hydrolase family 28 protein [Duncaniella sp.]
MNQLCRKAAVLLLFLTLGLIEISARDYARYYSSLPFETSVPVLPDIPSLTVSLADFGGKGDGVALNTEAFDSALGYLESKGGGRLEVGRGVWLTGPIVMRSNVELHLDKDAIVLFSPDKSLFPVIEADQGTKGSMRQPPVFAHNITNFAITGDGVFDGNGEYWRPYKRFKVSDAEWKKLERLKLKESSLYGSNVFYPTLTDPGDSLETKRARLIRVTGCSRFLIGGVVVQNSPSFHVNIVMSHDFVLDGITVRCPWNAQNGDGIDLSSCQRGLLVDCSVDCGDDAICLKSGIGDTGRQRGPCKDIVIAECTVFHGHGGFVIGSDNSGGMENIMVSDCRFIDTDVGLRFKSGRDRGGLMTNIFVDSVVMCDIAGEAILFDSYYEEKVGDAYDAPGAPVTTDTPRFDGFRLSGIICRDAGTAILCKGLREMPVDNVEIINSVFTARRGAVVNNAARFTLDNVTLAVPEGSGDAVTGNSKPQEKNLNIIYTR